MTQEETQHRLLDDLAPGGFAWEEVVRQYPIPALLLAAVGGFALGRSQGPRVLRSLSEFAGAQVADYVNELLGEEVLELPLESYEDPEDLGEP